MVSINPADGRRTEPQCQGARQVPVIAGTLAADTEGCFWQGVQGLFGGGQPASAASAPSPATPATPIRN
jgi:penicillin-binding protein 1B